MVQKLRSPDQTQISISIGKNLLHDVDQRASGLGLTRSQYLAMLARADLAKGGAMVLNELPNSSDSPGEALGREILSYGIKHAGAARSKARGSKTLPKPATHPHPSAKKHGEKP